MVLYNDGSRFLVRNGELKIEELKKESTKLSLIKGTIYSYVKNKEKEESKQT